MARSAWRRSRDSRRTVCAPGTTRVPLPVTILKPRPSWSPAVSSSVLNPEMTSASLGSATRQHSLNTTTTIMRIAATRITIVSAMAHRLSLLHLGDDHRARRQVVHDHDAGPGGQDVVAVSGVCVERLRAPTDRDHHLAQRPGGDQSGDPADLPHHLLIRHAVVLARFSDAECTNASTWSRR